MKACPVSEPPFSASALGWQEAETTLPVGSGLGLFILHTPRLGKPTNSGFLGSPWPAGVRGLLEAKTSLHIWKFTVHVLLKPRLENFEHYFTSV